MQVAHFVSGVAAHRAKRYGVPAGRILDMTRHGRPLRPPPPLAARLLVRRQAGVISRAA